MCIDGANETCHVCWTGWGGSGGSRYNLTRYEKSALIASEAYLSAYLVQWSESSPLGIKVRLFEFISADKDCNDEG